MRKNIILSFIDQGFLSLLNFGIGFLFIHYASKADYGVYSFCMIIILLMVGFQNALINTQMTVKTSRKPKEKQQSYCGAMFSLQYLLFLPIILLSVFIAWTLQITDIISESIAIIISAMAAGAYGMLIREFTRSYFYVWLKPGMVFTTDIIYILATISGLILLLNLLDLKAYSVLILIGLCAGSAGIFMLKRNQFIFAFNPKESKLAFQDSWFNGRWAMLGVTVTWIQSSSSTYLSMIFVGPEATAELNAARLLLMPVVMLNTSIYAVVKPYWSRWCTSKEFNKMKVNGLTVVIGMGLLIIVYGAILHFSQEIILALLYTKSYSNISTLILLWSLFFASQIIRMNYMSQLQMFDMFKYITLMNIPTSILTLTLGSVMVIAYGTAGSLLIMIIAELILASLLWWRTRIEYKKRNL
jgi:O-antigen/teichoic acid export membrane protein